MFSFAQIDSANSRGTIKIAKPKTAKLPRIYIKAEVQFGTVDNTGKRLIPFNDAVFIPFPIVDGYAYPFNYTSYFNNRFKGKSISLDGLEAATLDIEVKILANGKVSVTDRSPLLVVNGVAGFDNENVGGYELNELHVNCLEYVKGIKEWIPAYFIQPKKDKFKKTTVIKPDKKNVDATAFIRIYFSTSPFDY